MHAHIVSVSLVLVVRRISLCPCSSEFVSSGSLAAIEVVFPGIFRNCRIHDHPQLLLQFFLNFFNFHVFRVTMKKSISLRALRSFGLSMTHPMPFFPLLRILRHVRPYLWLQTLGPGRCLISFLSIFLADHVYPFGWGCIQEGELGETRSRPRQLLFTIIVPEVVDLLFKKKFCRSCPPDEVNKFQRDWERAFLCSAHGVLPFVEHDDDEQNSQQYSRSRVWLPSHPVLVVVLHDRESPFLLEVHCGALLHVQNLGEIGQMFGLHYL